MNKKYVDPNKRHYFDKLKISEFKGLFATFPAEQKIVMWEKGKSEDNLEEFIYVKYDTELKRIFLDLKTNFISKLKGCALENKVVAFRFNLEPFQYFSVSKLIFDKQEGLYYIDILEEIYMAQQRKNYRLNASNGIDIELVIGHHLLKCLDISAGGTSILVPEMTDQHIQVGQEFKACPLSFNDTTFIIQKVKIVKKFSPQETERGGTICYGVQFMSIEPATEEALALKVNTEARAKEIRKQMDEIKERKKQQSIDDQKKR